MSATKTHGVHYAWIAAGVMGAAAAAAWLVKDQWLAFSAAILGLYVLHMVSVRYIVRMHADQLAALTGADPASLALRAASSTPAREGEQPDGPATDGEGDEALSAGTLDSLPSSDADAPETDVDFSGAEGMEPPLKEVAIPRHFMLGTVAIVRNVMEPEAVARVLMEQRQQPGKRFGELAVAMDLVTDDQLEMLLDAQQRGLFTDAEIREARQRLETFRRAQAEPAASA